MPFLHELLTQVLSRENKVFALISRPIQSQEWNVGRTVLPQLNRLVEEALKARRFTIGGKPHDLIFIRIEIKTQMQRHQRVEDADGIMGGNMMQRLELP